MLWKNLGVKLSQEEEQALSARYCMKNDERMNYRSFCKAIEQPFNPNNLTENPISMIPKPDDL